MIIAVDFDGTIVEHEYPAIGEEIPYAIDTLKFIQEKGHKIILWTYRSGKDLEEAVEFCNKRGLFFYAVNNNYEDEEFDNTYSRKIYADLYIDDRNILGIPDWERIFSLLKGGETEEVPVKKSFIKKLIKF